MTAPHTLAAGPTDARVADGGPYGAVLGHPASFPTTPCARAATYLDEYVCETVRAARSIDPAAMDRAAQILLAAYSTGSHVFSCGNGGSASVANHLQCDHVKGVRTDTRLSPRVVSLSCNVELLTAIANDIGYEDVFVYQLQAQARPRDVLIAISSSGRSPNIVRALAWARRHGLRTIAFTGFDGGEASTVAEVSLHVDSGNYGVVEDLHQGAMHALAQYLRQLHMTADAIAAAAF